MINEKVNQANYNTWSEFYDQYPNPTVAIDDLNFPGFFKKLNIGHILEIGCGTGRNTMRLIEAGHQVTGIDLSEGMLKKAEEKISSSRLKLIKGNFMKDEIIGAPFDGAVMSLVLEHIEDLDGFFKKCESLLRGGCEFFFSEIHPVRSESGFLAHFKNAEGEDIELSSVGHQEKEIRLAAESNGFSVMRCDTVCGSEALAAINQKWQKHIGKPMIQIWQLKVD